MGSFVGLDSCQWLPGCKQVATLLYWERGHVLGVWDVGSGVMLKAQHFAQQFTVTVLRWQPGCSHCLLFLCTPDHRFTFTHQGRVSSTLHGVRSSTGVLEQLAEWDDCWTWCELAPDGSKLAAYLHGKSAVHILDIDVAELTARTEPALEGLDPWCSLQWAPDSRWLSVLHVHDPDTFDTCRVTITDTIADAGRQIPGRSAHNIALAYSGHLMAAGLLFAKQVARPCLDSQHWGGCKWHSLTWHDILSADFD